MATIEEALRAAHGTVRVSAAKAAELHALLTDLNYHTEAALLDARQHGLHQIAAELERVAELRNDRGSLRGLSDDGIPLARKRDQLIAQIEQHKDGGRAANPRKASQAEIDAAAAEVRQAIGDWETLFAEGGRLTDEIKRTEERALQISASYPVYGEPGWSEATMREGHAAVDRVYDERADLIGPKSREFFKRYNVAEKALGRAERKYERLVPSHKNYRSVIAITGGIPFDHPLRPQNHREGNPYGGRAENPPKKPVTVRFKPAELKAIAAQRGATYFVQSLERREAETGSWQEKVPGYFVASFLAGCQRHWTGLRYFRGNQVKIEPYGVNYDKPARSLSVSVKLDPNDTAAISEFTEVYVPSIVNGWIDAYDTKARQEAALGAAGRMGNPSDESERVRSAIVGLRSFVKGALSAEDAAHTGRHWTVDQPIYANGGTSATHLSRDAARQFDAAQARGELASSRGDQGWYVVFSQNLPIAWHTTADGWTVVDKSAVVGANPTTARNIAIVKGALGLR